MLHQWKYFMFPSLNHWHGVAHTVRKCVCVNEHVYVRLSVWASDNCNTKQELWTPRTVVCFHTGWNWIFHRLINETRSYLAVTTLQPGANVSSSFWLQTEMKTEDKSETVCGVHVVSSFTRSFFHVTLVNTSHVCRFLQSNPVEQVYLNCS